MDSKPSVYLLALVDRVDTDLVYSAIVKHKRYLRIELYTSDESV